MGINFGNGDSQGVRLILGMGMAVLEKASEMGVGGGIASRAPFLAFPK
jgi:hypothetical protein